MAPRGPRPRPVWVLTAAGIILALITILRVITDWSMHTTSDGYNHHSVILQFARSLDLEGPTHLRDLVSHLGINWPPGMLVLSGLLAHLVSEAQQVIRLFGLVLVPVLLWGVYRLGVMLGGSRAGLLSALLTMFSFGVVLHLREISIDLWSMATVVLAMLALLRVSAFDRPGPAVLFGGACGLCALFRLQFIMFVGLPALAVAAKALWTAGGWRRRARRLAWMGTSLATLVVVSSPYWSGRLKEIWGHVVDHTQIGAVPSFGDPTPWGGLCFYLPTLGHLAGWPVVLAAVGTLPLLVRRVPGTILLLLWIIGGVGGYIFTVAREARYLVPAIPALALLAGLGLSRLPRRYAALSALVLAGTVLPTLIVQQVYLQDPPKNPSWLYSWFYVRGPDHSGQRGVRRLMKEGLHRVLRDDPRGKDAYLVFYGPRNQFFLASMVPDFPEVMFADSARENLAEADWHTKARRKRRILLITFEMPLDFPLLWKGRCPDGIISIYQLTTDLVYKLPPAIWGV